MTDVFMVNGTVTVKNGDHIVVHVNEGSRDCLVAANTMLVDLLDRIQQEEKRWAIQRQINHISGMLYGFEEGE